MSHRDRVKRLEAHFSEQRAGRTLDQCLNALHRGDLAALEAQEQTEIAANGKAGWIGNLFATIARTMEGRPAIAPEDLERPDA